MIDYVAQFNDEKDENIKKMNGDPETARITKEFITHISKYQYVYNWSWMGRPIIQAPQDLLSMQEVIMHVKPDLIIETGIAHGGSAVFYASMLEILGDQDGLKREVVAIDNELRPHNRAALEDHAMYKRITTLDGSSTAPDIVANVHEIASRHQVVMVALDSCHSHNHVYEELKAYAPLVTVGSYVVVFDTNVEFYEETRERPWGKGNNPYTAAKQWLSEHDDFVCDTTFDEKALITAATSGWLLRVK